MYGKWVSVNFGASIKCEVFVYCTPNTPESELQHSAINILELKVIEQMLTKEAALS